jgi:hypothetical protein
MTWRRHRIIQIKIKKKKDLPGIENIELFKITERCEKAELARSTTFDLLL